MRVLLFDWHEYGHHATYLRRFSDALSQGADVTVAACTPVAAALTDTVHADVIDLGPGRPESIGSFADRVDYDRRELDLFERTARSIDATHACHAYADHLLPALAVQRSPDPIPKTLMLLRPRAHYPSIGSALSAKQRAAGATYEILTSRFRRRPDAGAVMSLDPIAVARWARRPGAPVHWIPEPWVQPGPVTDHRREGCVLYGHLSPRKGIDRLARAVERLEPGMRVVLAGGYESDFEPELDRHCETMTKAGARVERTGEIDESDAQPILGSAAVVVLPYRKHIGMSRVLVEAAVAGTPVIVDSFGLVGHLVGTHGLGAAIDTDDPALFASLLGDADRRLPAPEQVRQSVEKLAGRETFERAVSEVFGLHRAQPSTLAS